jgi:hypothetical protein
MNTKEVAPVWYLAVWREYNDVEGSSYYLMGIYAKKAGAEDALRACATGGRVVEVPANCPTKLLLAWCPPAH